MNLKPFKKIKSRYYWMSGIFVCMVILFTSISSRKSGIIQEVLVTVKPLHDGEKLVLENDVVNSIVSKYGSAIDGLAIREADVQKIEELAKENPFVNKAEVYIDARSRLCINVSQNNPVLRIFDKNGQSFYIDKDLKYFPVSRHASPRILIASGNIPPYDSLNVAQGKHVITELAKISEAVNKDQFSQSNTEQLYVEDDGDIVLAGKLGNQRFILGDAERIEEKLDYIKIYYENIASTEGWKRYRYVNLKFNGQIVCN